MKKPQEHFKYLLSGIDMAYTKDDEPRKYLGASAINKIDCDAYHVMTMRGYPQNGFPPRIRRIFKAGHVLEDVIAQDVKDGMFFKDIPYELYEVDPSTGEQWEATDELGHVIAHPDGKLVCLNEEGTQGGLEIKTMNNDKWDNFTLSGVKNSHPQYYSQMQLQMDMMDLEWTLFIAYNKNTSDYTAEIVELDLIHAAYLKARAALAYEGRNVKATKTNNFKCRFCNYNPICWSDQEPIPHCTYCRHSVPTEKNQWHCNKTGALCDKVCDDYDFFKPEDLK